MNSVAQKFKYNGVELEESLGLNLYEMDFRQYDAAIARFTGIDPVTHHSMSTYTAFDNNPVFWADPSGADSVGADGLTNDQWIELSRPGGGGADAMRAQARENFFEATEINRKASVEVGDLVQGDFVDDDKASKGPDPLAFLRHYLYPDAIYFAFTEDMSVFLGEGYEKGVIVILRGKDKGVYSAEDFGIGLGGVYISGSVEAVGLYYSGSTVTKDVFYGNRVEVNFGADFLGHIGFTASYSKLPDGNFVYGKGLSLGVGFSGFILSGNVNYGRVLKKGETPFAIIKNK